MILTCCPTDVLHLGVMVKVISTIVAVHIEGELYMAHFVSVLSISNIHSTLRMSF